MKRFTETNKWDDPWYRKLTPQAKHLLNYLRDKCDCAGVVEIDFEAISFHVGEAIQEKHLSELESRLQRMPNGKAFMPKFVAFQYGKLSRDCRPHMAVFDRLEFHGIPLAMVEQRENHTNGLKAYQRMRIIARDGLVCLYTGEPIAGLDQAEVDHFIPLSKGGLNRDENLFVASKAMNQLRKDKDVEAFCHENNIPFALVLERVSERLDKLPKGLANPFPVSENPSLTLQEKEEEKEKEKEEEEGVQGESGTSRYHKDARTVLWLLNEASGRSFRETDANLGFITARLREPCVTLEGVKLMIHRQCRRWLNTDQAEYLRPETLFNKTKFDGYYAAKDLPIESYLKNKNPTGSPL